MVLIMTQCRTYQSARESNLIPECLMGMIVDMPQLRFDVCCLRLADVLRANACRSSDGAV